MESQDFKKGSFVSENMLYSRTTLDKPCTLRVKVTTGNTEGEIRFHSSNSGVASVDDRGVIRYKRVGTAVIRIVVTGNLNTEWGECEVVVNVKKPGKPSFTPTSKKKGFIAISCHVLGAKGWQVRFSRFQDMSRATTLHYKNVGSRLYRQMNPTVFSGKRYYAQVRCYQNYKGENRYSDWSEVKTFVTE